MKTLLILSGKGGTGKTTIASSFIKLSKAKVYADCDVDAPNLHLIRGSEYQDVKESDYYGMPKAFIDSVKCIGCKKCQSLCRFDAIEMDENNKMKVNTIACEGCGVCKEFCEEEAIEMVDDVAGKLMLYEKEDEIFSTAKLKVGSGTSGKLVMAVKKQMMKEKKNMNIDADIAILDGSPGIGCPVVASLCGVDMVLVVTEPTMSGMSDMERIIKTASIPNIPTAVCVNKYNTNEERTKNIEKLLEDRKIPFVGKIPFDEEAVKAVNMGKTIVDVDCMAGNAVRKIFENTMKLLLNI